MESNKKDLIWIFLGNWLYDFDDKSFEQIEYPLTEKMLEDNAMFKGTEEDYNKMFGADV